MSKIKNNKNDKKFTQNLVDSMEKFLEKDYTKTKYIERIKTSYICIFLCILLIAYINSKAFNTSVLYGTFIAVVLINIYNIIKHILSIKDKQYIVHNKILIVFQSILIIATIILLF